MESRVVAIRGAIQVAEDSCSAIGEATGRLFHTICMANTLLEEEIISIMFSLTPDLTSMNPATALREEYTALQAPLFCTQEAVIKGMLPRTIRVIIHCYSTREEVSHIYLNGAASLRRDLTNNYS
jgi:chorismate mutase